MPYVMDWPPKRLMALAAAAFALLIFAPAASADTGTPCPMPSASQVFSQLGDSSNYALVPGGNFEGDMSGWTLNNASVVSGNESFSVGSSSDSQSLSIGPGGTAVSPSICVSNLFPYLRLFALNTQANNNGNSWSSGTSLRVGVQWTSPSGSTYTFPLSRLQSGDYQSWAATPQIPLGAPLPDGMTFNVRLVFSAGSSSSWQIDDVYVDPYAK